MNEEVKILDHGYLKLVESWGSDERIIESARMSTGKGFQGWGSDRMLQCPDHGLLEADYRKGDVCYPQEWCMHCLNEGKNCCRTAPTTRGVGDEKLLRYLYTHKHHTPFEMCGATFEVQAPIFVFREWHRHRTQSYNELSARYTPLPDVNYVPTVERCIVVPGSNRQASGVGSRVPTHEEVLDWLENYLKPAYTAGQRAYDRGLEIGIPKELARLPVAVARYTRMRASANLRNWLGFLTLRMDDSAQLEIRQYAGALDTIHDILAGLFPRTMELFDEGRKG